MKAQRVLNFTIEDHRDALATYFASLNDVVVAYLFGSLARNQGWAHSDVDIAVLLRAQTDRDRYFDLRLEIMGGVGDILAADDIDVVVLNEAPPALAYAVLRDGIRLFCRDHDVRIAFTVRAVNAYLDFKPILERHERAIFERASRGELFNGYNRHRGALERYFRVRERLEGTPDSDV